MDGSLFLNSAPIEQVVHHLGQHALEDALGNAVRDVAVELRIVAPQAQIVNRGADDLVPDDAVLGVVFDLGVLAEDLDHVLERECYVALLVQLRIAKVKRIHSHGNTST